MRELIIKRDNNVKSLSAFPLSSLQLFNLEDKTIFIKFSNSVILRFIFTTADIASAIYDILGTGISTYSTNNIVIESTSTTTKITCGSSTYTGSSFMTIEEGI